MNPLLRYRREQARVRELFDPFTREHCPGCATPCCMKPTRVRPVDLILIEELSGVPVRPSLEDGAGVLLRRTGLDPDGAAQPCDHLGPGGCVFPSDLRPFGCVAFICEPMRRVLPAEEVAVVETAVERLAAAHEELMQVLQP